MELKKNGRYLIRSSSEYGSPKLIEVKILELAKTAYKIESWDITVEGWRDKVLFNKSYTIIEELIK